MELPKPTYIWSDLPAYSTFNVIFENFELKIINKKKKWDYFEIPVIFLESSKEFYGNERNDKMIFYLGTKSFNIALSKYKDRKYLKKIKATDRLYVTLFTKNRQTIEIKEIVIVEEKEEYIKPKIQEEYVEGDIF